jgi:hypothetical protein
VKTNSKQPFSNSNRVNNNLCSLSSTSERPFFKILVILPSAQNKSSMGLFHRVGCCTCHFLLPSVRHHAQHPHITLFICPLLSQFAPTLTIDKLLIQYMVRPFLLPTTILLPVSALLFPNLPSCSIETHGLFSVYPALTALVFFLYEYPDCLLPHYQLSSSCCHPISI